MNWPTVQLSSVADIRMGQSPPGDTYNESGEGLPFFQDQADFGRVHPTIRKWCAAPSRSADKGDILLSVRAPVGPTNVAPTACCIGHGLAAIRAKPNLAEQGFVRHFFKYIEPVLFRRGQGSTVAAINRHEVEQLQIPLPPLSEQRRIVEILDQADELQRKRAEADEKARRILPTLFIGMFGDPATNPLGWTAGTLGNVISEAQYGISTRADADESGISILRMNNIDIRGRLNLSDLKYVNLDQELRRKYMLAPGDILFNRTNIKELVGKTGLWRGELEAVPDSHVIRVRLDRQQTLPEFVWAYMNTQFMKHVLFNRARQAIGLVNINAEELRSFPLFIPELRLQKAFADRVKDIEKLVTVSGRARSTQDRVIHVLTHRAFSGDLTARWRDTHADALGRKVEEQGDALTTACEGTSLGCRRHRRVASC